MPVILDLLHSKPAIQLAAIRTGLNATEAEKLVTEYHLQLPELATILSMTPHGLLHCARRNLRLNPVASERLFRLARVARHAADIFNDPLLAGEWLSRPHTLLDQATPLSMLDTAYGEQEVERILYSIEYGLPV